MSTMVRDLRDEEDDVAGEGEEGESEGEESEDEDYVPPAVEDDDSDGDDADAYDEDILEIGGASKGAAGTKAAAKPKGAGSKRAKSKPKGKPAKRPRAGGIVDEDEEELGTTTAGAAMSDPVPADSKAAASAAAPAPSRADALWAELQGTSSSADATKVKPAASGGGGLDIKALLAKTAGTASAHTKDDRMVEIKEKVDFCGEEVTVTKRVKAGSKEELAFRQTQGGDGAKAPAAASTKDLVANALAASANLKKQMEHTRS